MSNSITITNTGNYISVTNTPNQITVYDGALPETITAESYEGLTAWVDASVAAQMYTDYPPVTPVASDGDAVAYYGDLSPQANNFLQSSAASKPLYKTNRQNGLSGILFQGTDDYIYSNPLNVFFPSNVKTMVMVLKNVGSNAQGFIGDQGGYFFGYWADADTITFYNYDGNSDAVVKDVSASGTAFVLTFWHTAGSMYLQVNDGTPSAGTASGGTTLMSGVMQLGGAGGSFANFDLYELAIYSQPLSSDDRAALVASLMTKWGIA
jgi:hypothetical protein